MKNKAQIIGLMVLLIIVCGIVYGAEEKKANVELKLEWKANEEDRASFTTIILDSSEIVFLKSFLKDSINYSEADSIMQSDIERLELQLSTIQSNTETDWLWLIIAICIIGFFCLAQLVYLIVFVRKENEDIDKLKYDVGMAKRLAEKASNNNNPIPKEYIRDYSDLRTELNRLTERIIKLEDALNESEKKRNAHQVEPKTSMQFVGGVQHNQSTPEILYADSIKDDGVFFHISMKPNDDTVFVLELRNEEKAKVSLYEPAYNKLLANRSFLVGCDVQDLGNTSIIVTHEGSAIKETNGKWKMISKVKVETR